MVKALLVMPLEYTSGFFSHMRMFPAEQLRLDVADDQIASAAASTARPLAGNCSNFARNPLSERIWAADRGERVISTACLWNLRGHSAHSVGLLARHDRRPDPLAQGILAKFEQFPANGLAVDAAADRDLVIRNIQSQLLSLENIRMWEKNPDVYSSGITSSAFTIMSRSLLRPKSACSR